MPKGKKGLWSDHTYGSSKGKVKKPSAKKYEDLTGQGLGSLVGGSNSTIKRIDRDGNETTETRND